MCCSLAGPLLLSFDKKVAFYKKWRYVFPAMIFPGIFYIVWDAIFTANGIWHFNNDYIIGAKLFGLPAEEIAFFFIVPYCCSFIYECIRCYFPRFSGPKNNWVYQFLAITLFFAAIFFHDRDYTFYTCLFTAVFLCCYVVFKKHFTGFNPNVFLIAYLIILLPFLIVNGLLTSIPVVIYNNAENMGVRIYTIPVEDVFYGMLLAFMNIAGFEKLRNRSVISNS
ncbi:MAG: rane protein [Ferruginibacter sp.]|nr:rane protein [Ferruginibacter sp.]